MNSTELPAQTAAPVQTAAVEPVPPPESAPSRGVPALPLLDQRAPVAAAAAPTAAPAPRPAASGGAFVVLAASFSTADNARRAASALDGEVTQAGQYYRVRTGTFATRGEAEASLAKVRAAGYSDARILTNG